MALSISSSVPVLRATFVVLVECRYLDRAGGVAPHAPHRHWPPGNVKMAAQGCVSTRLASGLDIGGHVPFAGSTSRMPIAAVAWPR